MRGSHGGCPFYLQTTMKLTYITRAQLYKLVSAALPLKLTAISDGKAADGKDFTPSSDMQMNLTVDSLPIKLACRWQGLQENRLTITVVDCELPISKEHQQIARLKESAKKGGYQGRNDSAMAALLASGMPNKQDADYRMSKSVKQFVSVVATNYVNTILMLYEMGLLEDDEVFNRKTKGKRKRRIEL